MPRWEEIEVFVPAPRVNGATLSPPDPRGCRCVAATTTVSHVRLDNDVLQQPPDGANAAGVAMLGYNMIRIFADGDDLCVIFDAAGTAAPDPAANSTAASCEIIPKGQFIDYMVSATFDKYINVRSRASAAQMRYRISAPLSSQK